MTFIISKEPYMTSTAVFLAELLKFVISSSLVFIYDVKMNSKQFTVTLKQELGIYMYIIDKIIKILLLLSS